MEEPRIVREQDPKGIRAQKTLPSSWHNGLASYTAQVPDELFLVANLGFDVIPLHTMRSIAKFNKQVGSRSHPGIVHSEPEMIFGGPNTSHPSFPHSSSSPGLPRIRAGMDGGAATPALGGT